ncbi:MAG: hypothetical protein IQL11_02435, partial [Bacteroidales bacterium]|nr:hypothetical protein [Bacteroidales bacterium]
DSLGNLPLVLNYSNVESKGPADYFIYQVKNEASRIVQEIDSATGKKWNLEEDGLIITTTLDLTLQNYVNSSFHDHLAVMQKRLSDQYESDSGKIFLSKLAGSELGRLNLGEKANEVGVRQIFDWKGYYSDSISVADSLEHELKLLHAGLLAIDPVTGAVKAWAGGIDFQTHPYDQILAQRQLASTFKPILYAAALEKGIDPCFYLNNDSIVVVSDDEWKPRNFDDSYGGKYSLAGALVHSMNIPTFNLFRIVGYGRLDSLWKEMGFTFHMVNTPSLAVGTAEANIVEVASAYALFANGGYKIAPEIIVSLKDPAGNIVWQNEFKKCGKRVISERTSILIGAILQRAVREGTGAALRSVYGVTLPLAGKTGTSQDYADAWFAAFNPSLVMVSRVGATFPSVHFNSAANGSGSTLALPLVAMTLRKVQNDQELRAKLITQFHELPAEMAAELNCPDYREKRLFENILDIFRKDRIEYGKESDRTDQKKRSIFKKLFNPKNRR